MSFIFMQYVYFFLFQDGFVFTYDRIKTACAGKCGKSGYAEI